MVDLVSDGYLREGKRYVTVAIGCTGRQAPQRGDGREPRRAAGEARRRGARRPPRPGSRVTSPGSAPVAGRPAPAPPGSRVVALGGGHGLAATLRALRRVTDDVTAVVAVSDDGGSSGRLREEFDVVPPGDLRMALAALCGDDTWGRTWSRVVQHRFAGSGDLAGHSLGNLLITALWEETGDIVTGLDWVGALLGAHGRVLPVATTPLQVVADVAGLHPEDPCRRRAVVGQVAGRDDAAARSSACGSSRPTPRRAPRRSRRSPTPRRSCSDRARGSPACSRRCRSGGSARPSPAPRGRVVVVLNLAPQPGETSGFSPQRHLEVLAAQMPGLGSTPSSPTRPGSPTSRALAAAASALGARLALAPVASRDGTAAPRRRPPRLRPRRHPRDPGSAPRRRDGRR